MTTPEDWQDDLREAVFAAAIHIVGNRLAELIADNAVETASYHDRHRVTPDWGPSKDPRGGGESVVEWHKIAASPAPDGLNPSLEYEVAELIAASLPNVSTAAQNVIRHIAVSARGWPSEEEIARVIFEAEEIASLEDGYPAEQWDLIPESWKPKYRAAARAVIHSLTEMTPKNEA